MVSSVSTHVAVGSAYPPLPVPAIARSSTARAMPSQGPNVGSSAKTGVMTVVRHEEHAEATSSTAAAATTLCGTHTVPQVTV